MNQSTPPPHSGIFHVLLIALLSMGLFGSAEAQIKKQNQAIKPAKGSVKTTYEDPSSMDPPTTPGDPSGCETCGNPQNPAFTPFSGFSSVGKGFFVCDPRFRFGLGTQNPSSRIEIKGNFSDEDYSRGLRLSYLNGTVCEDLMFEYGGGDDSYIGSLSDIDFHLRTANLPRLSISKSGKVGINNNSGLAQFSVNGTTVLGNIESSHAASISANDVLITDKLSINTSGYENQLTVGGNAAIGYTAAAPENGLLVQGNVGIGTTTLTEKLEVNGTIKANNLKLTGLNNGLISNQNGTFGNATPEQVATLLGITGTEDYIPKFGSGTALENSYIRQAGVDGRKCIGLGINDNSTFNLVENFHFSNFQTLHVDGGGSHFGFNTYSKLEGSNWTYPRLYTEINNTQLGASDIIQHADGRISFNNLKPTENPLTDWKTVMTLTPDRKVGIGVVEPTASLDVKGDFRLVGNSGNTELYIQENGELKCRKVKVTLDNLNDIVFLPEYKLLPLKEVETYIKTNGHLPEVPSQAEVAKEGMDVGEMNNILLKKIEEMTLHLIRLEKEIEALKTTK